MILSQEEKILQFYNDPLFHSLSPEERSFLGKLGQRYRLTHQQLKKLIDLACDLQCWEEGPLSRICEELLLPDMGNREVMQRLSDYWEALKAEEKDYQETGPGEERLPVGDSISRLKILELPDGGEKILGKCPVASDKTRCCNLLTLDAVLRCGYGCTYCSIQNFYGRDAVYFHSNLADKLARLNLERGKIHHLGTGQSSDSLLWGNRMGLLDSLVAFARENPNIILEFKSKSANIGPLLKTRPPANLIATWSLNTQKVISAEEHLTASLSDRLQAARAAADAGILVGFHFHPIVVYKNWEKEYAELIREVQDKFKPEEVVMVSFGTVTLIKPVIRQIRASGRKTKILQMPLKETAGKYSYPQEIKIELFRATYNAFSQAWKEKVFFYLCMEDPEIWEPVFGFSYQDNGIFEGAMKDFYMRKIEGVRKVVEDNYPPGGLQR